MVKKLTWSDNHIKKYKWLFNKYKMVKNDIQEENFIDENKRGLLTFIEKIGLSNSSKEQLYFLVGRYLDIKKDRYAKTYKQAGYNLMLLKDKEEGENKQDEREKEKYKHLSYFLEIIKSFDMNKLNNKELLLCLLTLQPPLRTSFYYSAKIIRQEKDNNKEDNYILLNYRHKKAYYIVNSDKVSNSKEYSNYKNSKIQINNKELVKALLNKYKENPSIYIFGDTKKTNISILRWLEDITKIKGLNIDNMRSIYITWFYNKKITHEEKRKLALSMRHSILTASKNYFKIVDNSDEIENNKSCEDIKNKLMYLENKNVYEEQLIKDEKLNKKRRYDIIFNINNKGAEPRDTTIKKYNLEYDEENDIWF